MRGHGIATESASYSHKKEAKMVHHLEIHPAMDGGHRVEVHHSSMHEPAKKEFAGPHEAVSLPKGHILHHIAGHLGIATSDLNKAEEREPEEEA